LYIKYALSFYFLNNLLILKELLKYAGTLIKSNTSTRKYKLEKTR